MVGNNAKNLIKQLLSSCGTQGLLEAKDVGGTTRYIADYSAYPAVVEDDFTLVAANAGISVGSGNSTPSANDYQLGSTITSGLTGTVVTEKEVDASGNASIIFTVTISNTSGADITISEIGYKQEIAASDAQDGTTATDRVFLLDRSVFDSVTIAANGSAVIEYTLKAVVTNNGGAEGTKTITQNGTYNALDDSLDGYSTVTVAVPSAALGTKNISANGTYNASSDSLDGYSSVSVAVPGATLGTKSITQNGTYNASSDSLDGYSQVTVNVSGGGGGGSGSGITGLYPIKWAGYLETQTIAENSGKYFIFFVICGWGNAYHPITDMGGISGVTNATYTEIDAYADGNSDTSKCSEMYRMYLIEKTDETQSSSISLSGSYDDFALFGLKGAPTFGTFHHNRAQTSANIISLNTDYTMLIVLENTDRAGKSSINECANDINVVNSLCAFASYSSYQRGWVYILTKSSPSALLTIRGNQSGEFDPVNVYMYTYVDISIGSPTDCGGGIAIATSAEQITLPSGSASMSFSASASMTGSAEEVV